MIHRVAATGDQARLQVWIIGTFHLNSFIGYLVLLNYFLRIFADFEIQQLIKMCDHLIWLLLVL
jgi:hypothetical protein